MGILKDKYEALLNAAEPTKTLTESTVGSMTILEWYDATVSISSVSDVGGNASFNFTPGPTLVVGQVVRITGFIVETTYNGTFTVTASSTGDFETGVTYTGTEVVGDFEVRTDIVTKLVADDCYKALYESDIDFIEDELAPNQRDSVQTTDAATSTLLSTIVIAASTSQIIMARIFLTETDTDAGYMEINATVYRAAAGDPVISAADDGAAPIFELQPGGWGGVSATFSVNSPDIEINVTGVAATTIDWSADIHLEPFI